MNRCVRIVARLAACAALVVVLAFCGVLPASAQHGYVDRRVDAIPAATLLSADPRTLLDSRRQEISRVYSAYRRPLFIAWAFSQILTLAYLWRSGNAARLRDWLRPRIGSPMLLRFVYGVALALITGLATIPAALAQYRVGLVFDQVSEPIGVWLRDGAIRLSLDALAVGLIVTFVLALVDLTRLWYAVATLGLLFAALALGFAEPVVFAPFFNRDEPLAATSPTAESIRALERANGAAAVPILVEDDSRRSAVAGARVDGFGATARIVVSDTLLRSATPGEVRFVIARELSHYRHADGFRTALVQALLFVFCIALAVFVSDRIGFRRDDDPLARLALNGALIGVAALLVFPLYTAYHRHLETRADREALALVGDPASAVRLFVRVADQRFVPYCPSRSVRLYFDGAPPTGSRIAAATGRPDPCP